MRSRSLVLGLSLLACTTALAGPGDPVTLASERMEVREVVAWIGSFSGQRLAVDDDVQGEVTLCVVDAPWEDVLAAVAHATSSVVVRRPGGLALATRGEPERLVAPALAPREEPKIVRRDPKRRISVDEANAPLAEVMERIARQVGATIEVDPGTQESVTVSLRDIPWREAVDVIARMTRCEVTEHANGALVVGQPVCVTIDFTRVNLRLALRLLAAYACHDIVIGPDVRGFVTTNLRDLERGLPGLARAAGLAVEARRRVVHVGRPGWGEPVVAPPAPEREPADPEPLRLRARGAPADVLLKAVAGALWRDVALVGASEAELATPVDVDADDAPAALAALQRTLGWTFEDAGRLLVARARLAAPRATAPARVTVRIGDRTYPLELQATALTLAEDGQGCCWAVISGQLVRHGGLAFDPANDEELPLRVVAIGDGTLTLRGDAGDEVVLRLPD